MYKKALLPILLLVIAFLLIIDGCRQVENGATQLPKSIQAIMNKPRYAKSSWGLRVIDMDTGELIYDLHPYSLFEIASVRKLFSVGNTLDVLGGDYRFSTAVYRQGNVDEGILDGDLVLVASGDWMAGGRRNPDDTVAFTSFDHTEANSLGSAILTQPDPLSGLKELASQIAHSGIREVKGEVIIDDRLFEPFIFRDEFTVAPLMINDSLIDVSITPTEPGAQAHLEWRPQTAAFEVEGAAFTGEKGENETIKLAAEEECVGQCQGRVAGIIPENFRSELTGEDTLVRTFRVKNPTRFTRTAFIEALQKEGVAVSSALVGPNPIDKLAERPFYNPGDKVAELISPPYSEYAKLILKVSHNLGADLSLILFGLSKGENTLQGALNEERKTLTKEFGIDDEEFFFVDGSGGRETASTPQATVKFLKKMSQKLVFPYFIDALPILGVDGSLASIKVSNPQAHGKVRAKTGTFVQSNLKKTGAVYKAQTLAGFIDTKSGRRLLFALFVNDAGPYQGVKDAWEVFTDQATIASIIYEKN